MLLFGREGDDADHRPLPDILMIQFRNRNIELKPQLVLQAAQHLALILQRLRIGNMQFQSEQSYGHQDFRERLLAYFFPAGTPD